MPLAESKLVIDNEFRTDLEEELWEGDEITEEIREAGVRMGDLDLLPAPFPIEDLLSERELRHVKRLYGIGGLSYGNLSSRKDDTRFWMSASGVDKTKLDVPGRDILLVSGYDPVDNKMILSVPPNVEPRRVSVDAIEHWMIYQAHPDVGAILHVHAWVEGIPATDVNYPCGTEELAVSVAELLALEAGSRARGDRPPKPRHHRDRREPHGDPRPDRAARPAADPDVLAGRRARLPFVSRSTSSRFGARHREAAVKDVRGAQPPCRSAPSVRFGAWHRGMALRAAQVLRGRVSDGLVDRSRRSSRAPARPSPGRRTTSSRPRAPRPASPATGRAGRRAAATRGWRPIIRRRTPVTSADAPEEPLVAQVALAVREDRPLAGAAALGQHHEPRSHVARVDVREPARLVDPERAVQVAPHGPGRDAVHVAGAEEEPGARDHDVAARPRPPRTPPPPLPAWSPRTGSGAPTPGNG